MGTNETPPFGVLLKRFRHATGLTQEALATRASYSAIYIRLLERGVRTPLPATVAVLAEALQLSDDQRSALTSAARARRAPPGNPLAIPGGALHRPRLVGRTRELAAIGRLLHGEGPPVVALAGDPGIGKSRLLLEAESQAEASGWAVLRGGSVRPGGQEPYAPVLGALSAHLRGQSRSRRRTLLDGCAWLARLLPELAEAGELAAPAPQPPEQERRLMYAAVERLLANAADSAGTLLLLDDLHWAQPDGLDLLGAIVRAAPGGLRVVGAYRETEVGARDPLALLFGDLAHDDLLAQLVPGLLAPDEARALLDDLFDQVEEVERVALEERLLTRAGGVPFYLVSLARAAQAGSGDGAVTAASADERVPWDVTHSIRQRVALLRDRADELVSAVAVASRPVEHGVLEAVAERLGYDPQATLRALEAALASRLLRASRDAAYGVAHDLIRDVVVADLATPRRRTLHRLLAEALEARVDEIARRRRAGELAWHYRQAGASERALGYALLAGDQAEAVYAHADAEAQYRVALELALERADWAREAEARLKLGQIYVIVARRDEATAMLGSALEVYAAAGDATGQVRAADMLGVMYYMAGSQALGIVALERVLARVSIDAEATCAASAYATLSYCYWLDTRYHEASNAATRSVELAQAAGNAALLAQAELNRAAASLALGHVEEAGATLERILPTLRAAGDLLQEGWALETMAIVHEVKGELATSERCVEQALALAESMGYIAPLVWERFRHALYAYYRGDWSEALTMLERAIATWGDGPTPAQARYPLFWLGRLLRLRGETVVGVDYHKRGTALIEDGPGYQYDWLVVAARAEDDLLAGAAQDARARVLGYLDGLAEPTCLNAIPLAAPLAEAYLALGRAVEADTTVSTAIMQARSAPHRLALVDLLRVKALVAAHGGRREEGEAAAAEAVLLARALPYPYAEAKARYVHALLDAAHGEPERARTQLEVALGILDRLGERPYAERVARALAQVGGEAARDAAV